MESKLYTVMGNVLGVSPESITENSSMETLRSWDSLMHMALVAAIEEEFPIEPLTTEEIVTITSVEKIKSVLRNKGVMIA